jgi:hypothetical protein
MSLYIHRMCVYIYIHKYKWISKQTYIYHFPMLFPFYVEHSTVHVAEKPRYK